MNKLRPIMFVGTGSDVGKSVINTGFCRVFLQDGFKPAPFKAQNLSLNSFATPDGFEIGRAQAVQAEACCIDCSAEMNPILLKPSGYKTSQVVLHGKPIGKKTAFKYFEDPNRDLLFSQAMSAFKKLENKYNPIVVEGAGSITEMNLWEKDIVNMRVALQTNAATYLIADIDRGGVFGSIYGSLQLLPERQRKAIKGILINKFRGDINLFSNGKAILEDLVGIPVVGIIPYFEDIFVEQEDAVAIDRKTKTSMPGNINIAVVLLKHMSNFTDFNLLEQLPGVHLYYASQPKELVNADIVVIPGSKNVINDLLCLRKTGMAKAIMQNHKNGKPVYGICGGYQIMGQSIKDPYQIEGEVESIPGLGILPITTTLHKEKKTEQCQFMFLDNKEICTGYEIHMGESSPAGENPLCKIGNSTDGYFLNPKTWGTYIHGIFDNTVVVKYILGQVKKKSNFQIDYREYKNSNYDRLAKLIRNNVDMQYIYKTMQWDMSH